MAKATIEDLQRTVDFLGKKMRARSCPRCGMKYKSIAFKGEPKVCPPCSDKEENPNEQ